MYRLMSYLADRACDELVSVPYAVQRLAQEFIDELRVTAARAIGVQTERRAAPAVRIPVALTRGHIPIGRALGAWRSPMIYMPHGHFRHGLVLGATGAGKTEWLKQYVCHCSTGVAFLDNTDGEAVADILRALPDSQLDRVVVLDHADVRRPLGVGHFQQAENAGDPFAADLVTQQWAAFFAGNFGIEGMYRTEELLAMACRAVFSLPDGTIYDVYRMVSDRDYRAYVLSRVADSDVQEWWARYSALSDNEHRAISAAFEHRANLLMGQRFLRYTLGQVPPAALDYGKWMQDRRIVLIRAPESLGRQAVRVIMGLHMIGFWQAALARDSFAPAQRVPFYVICDEPQTWLTGNRQLLDDLFSKARKYAMYVFVACQSLKQIAQEHPALLAVVLENRPDVICFRTAPQPQLGLGPYAPEQLPKYQFVARIGDHAPVLATGLGRVKSVRSDVSAMVEAARTQYCRDYREVAELMERRERECRGAADSSVHQYADGYRLSGLRRTSGRVSRLETGRSSDSSIYFG